MINYDIFFRRSGVRLPQHLLSPNYANFENFSFPKSSLHHFTTFDNIVTGPSAFEYLYRDIEKKIFVYHVLEGSSDQGEPRKVAIPLEPLVRDFHIRNKRFRRAIKLENIPKDENTLTVVNYALLTKSQRYMKSMYAEFNRWTNLNKTVWNTASQVARQSDRNQFVFLELPKNLPSVQRLNSYLDKVNPSFLEYFRDPNALMLLELWKWLDPETRSKSVMAAVDPSEMNRINLVYQESGRMLVLNMGLVNSWIYSKSATSTEQRTRLPPDKIRKCFLRMLMGLMEYRTVDASVDEEMIAEKATQGESEENGEATIAVPTTPIETSDTVTINNDSKVLETTHSADQQVMEEEAESFEERFKDMEKDLDQLDILEKEQDIENALQKNEVQDQGMANSMSGEPIDLKDFDQHQTPSQILKDTCDKLTDDGLMSGAEYRKYLMQIDRMEALESPVGKGTITDFVKIPESDISLKEPVKFKDKFSVVDKSMLESSLELFDKNYINQVLSKDVVSMPLALQKAGFVISKYDIETHEDILGESETHVIRINPIVGKPNTIRIKIPKIRENGKMMVGGTQYFMRKQRGD